MSFWDSSDAGASGVQGPANLFPTQVTVTLFKSNFPGCLTTNLTLPRNSVSHLNPLINCFLLQPDRSGI